MFHGTHYIGEDILTQIKEGETWRKVFGPFLVYLNSTPDVSEAHNLWIDAKEQVFICYKSNLLPIYTCIAQHFAVN